MAAGTLKGFPVHGVERVMAPLRQMSCRGFHRHEVDFKGELVARQKVGIAGLLLRGRFRINIVWILSLVFAGREG